MVRNQARCPVVFAGKSSTTEMPFDSIAQTIGVRAFVKYNVALLLMDQRISTLSSCDLDRSAKCACMTFNCLGIHGSSIRPQREFDRDCNRHWDAACLKYRRGLGLSEPHDSG